MLLIKLDSESCPKYFEGFYQCIKEPPYSTMMDKDRELMESLPKQFNIQINNTIVFLIFVDSILSSFRTLSGHNSSVDSWHIWEKSVLLLQTTYTLLSLQPRDDPVSCSQE